MNVLVTGGAGFIGSHVADSMIEAGHRVSIVDNLWKHGGGQIKNINPRAKFYEIDICSPALATVFEKEQPEVICHHAAQHSVRISINDPEYDAQVNILGLLNLLQCATHFKSRKIIFASSGATYGTVTTVPINEHTIQNPISPYGITKTASEHYLRFWQKVYGLSFTSLRYGNVYGPRQNPTGEAGVVAIFIRAMLKGEKVYIDWDGEQERDYVYVQDVARANVLAMLKGDGEAYCIATSQSTSVNTLYHKLVKTVGHEVEVVRSPKRPGDIRMSYFDCRKAKESLGWTAETDLDGVHLN
ncbi:GDP-mannose 4,6-dehydratase [Spirulina sp. CCNP1310]|uniref:GDP-mannose 4,6-dehydratase n=1 Tax=Spirulina sp. CCNP1310 TaxID=3110249 RepID=UPI002B21D908|nr:GDP-mannose 4,6-dehydratase [Spirulina sp. CCNP1310]MEA5418933.1 GDP-mannose 4,6-dehydratase [Spirulina sp. CCNP1310]